MLSQFTNEGTDKRTLAEFNFPKDVYPVGRLDYDSEGLLLLSNDGTFINTVLNPKFAHSKTYLAQVENVPTMESVNNLRQGLLIENKLTAPAMAYLLAQEPLLPTREISIRYRKNIPTSFLEITITEGRNRQVRKMTAKIGCPTLRLYRIAVGNLRLNDLNLELGSWQFLSKYQVLQALQNYKPTR